MICFAEYVPFYCRTTEHRDRALNLASSISVGVTHHEVDD